MAVEIKIGYEGTEEDDRDILDYDDRPIRKKQHKEREVKEIYISPEREKKILASYEDVIVQEFGDDYHVSEEILKQRNKFYEVFKIRNKARNKYRKLNEYVDAMRLTLNCVRAVAENNGVYDPDVFMAKWSKGEIKIYGLKIPRYIKKDAKRINWQYVSEFILSDEDSKNIMQKDADHVEIDQYESLAKTLFDPGELERITRKETEEERALARHNFLTQTSDIITPLTRKELKEIGKSNPEFMLNMKDIRKRDRSISQLSRESYIGDIVYADMEEISRYDRKHRYTKHAEEPVFSGSIMKDKDVDRFAYQMHQYSDYNTYEYYEGKLMTPAEIRELELKDALQQDGWNIRRLYGNAEKEKRMRRAAKLNLKKQKKIKKRLIKLQKRNDQRTEDIRRSFGTRKKKKKGKRK